MADVMDAKKLRAALLLEEVTDVVQDRDVHNFAQWYCTEHPQPDSGRFWEGQTEAALQDDEELMVQYAVFKM